MSDIIKAFGRLYGEVGDTKKDLILNTSGEIKVRVGKKFFNLFKNGQIEGTNSTSISFTEDISQESSNGFYIDSEGSIYVIYDDSTYTLRGSSVDYVSYNEEQQVTREQQYQALQNIGFIYPTLKDASNVTNGIVYIEEEHSLYIVMDGELKNFISEAGSINKIVITNGSNKITITPTDISGVNYINNILSFSPTGIITDQIDSSDGLFSLSTNGDESLLQVDKIETSSTKDISNLCELYVEPPEGTEVNDNYPGYLQLQEAIEDRLLTNYYLEYSESNTTYHCAMHYGEKTTIVNDEEVSTGRFEGSTFGKTFIIEGNIKDDGSFYTTYFSH